MRSDDLEPHDVVALLYDGVQMLDVTGPIDAFASANALGANYRITHASISGADVVASSGARHGADMGVDDLPARIGTLLVPGTPNWQASITDTALVDAIRNLAERSRRIVSICAGAFPLAATGLLDGRRAATHWKLARRPRRALPRRRRRLRCAVRHGRQLRHLRRGHGRHRSQLVAHRRGPRTCARPGRRQGSRRVHGPPWGPVPVQRPTRGAARQKLSGPHRHGRRHQ